MIQEYWTFFEFAGWEYDQFMRTPLQVRLWLLEMIAEKSEEKKWFGYKEFSKFRAGARAQGADI